MNGKLPLVVIGVPCGDMVHSDFAMCLYGLGRGSTDVRQGISLAKNSVIANGRNNLVDIMFNYDADYLFQVDSDMVFPPDTLNRLLAHDKDIVGGTYVRRGPPFDNLGQSTPEYAAARSGLVRMFYIPAGMLLVRRKVFETLGRPYFSYKDDPTLGCVRGEDMTFCERAREAGFQIWCDLDLSMELRHIYTYHLSPLDPSTRAVAENFKAAEALAQAEAQGHG